MQKLYPHPMGNASTSTTKHAAAQLAASFMEFERRCSFFVSRKDEHNAPFGHSDQGFDLNSLAGRNDAQKRRSAQSGHAPAHKASTEKSTAGRAAKTDGMDISSVSAAEKKRRKRSKKDRKKRGPMAKIGRVLLSLFLICVITGSIVVGAFAVYVFGFIDDTMDENLNELKMNFTTTLYVKDSETGDYTEYQRLHGTENRIWVSLDEIPEDLANAYIAIEDQRFRSHTGVDWKRTIGAFGNLIFKFWDSNQGGSTITQQLVKNLTGDNDQSPMRKVREIMRARNLEENYTKDVIIECYLNTIALANGINGVEVASNYYFDKHVSDLTLAECATLAAMAKEPEYYRPDEHPENNKERRLNVLWEMYDQELISSSEYEQAKNEEVTIVADRANLMEVEINNWFVDMVIDEVVDDLVETYGFDESHAAKNFYNGGYKIYCTMDPEIQTILEDVYKDSDNFARCTSSADPDALVQSAMTIMDYEGHIVATVGGRGEKTGNRGLHRATVPRPVGSTMKPIGVYAPALEANLITYGSTVEDKPIRTNIGGVMQNWPRNYSGYYSYSKTTVANALERSLNTIPVRILQDLGLENSYDFLTNKLGITSLDETNDLALGSLALGGNYHGISPTEMAAAYATFGNLGKYYEPTTYTKVTDQYDEVILSQKKPTIAMGEDTANIMNHMLQNVVFGSSGTGSSASFGNMPIFGKTGTTSEDNDRWFVGGTPYYVAASWFGFDTPSTIYASGNPAITPWRTVMRKIHADLSYKSFEESSAVSYVRICASSGMAATQNCGATYRGWMKDSYMPACTTHGGSLLSVLDKPTGIIHDAETGYSGSSSDDDEDDDTASTTSTTSGNTSSTVSGDTSSSDGNASDTTSATGSEDTVTSGDGESPTQSTPASDAGDTSTEIGDGGADE